MPPAGPNVLMLYPRFSGDSFWDARTTAGVGGARMIQPPLGLLTVAAMLPEHWRIRLVDRNCADLADEDLRWADLVMTGGMLAQQIDALEIVRLCHAARIPVVVGGPDVTSSPHRYADADFKVIGEAEPVIADFVRAWESGVRQGVFVSEKFKADVTTSPIPRFDLVNFADYLRVGVQFSRGCPFTCEFCDIIELYGRVPRAKTPDQVIAELDALHALGFRGRVDFVDDNLVGNKKALRALLRPLVAWQRARGYPFELSTEASVNIADDVEVLSLMKEANFHMLFVGIESPDADTLVGIRKKQNTRRDLVQSIHTIYAHGMWVTAGFILGFDDEPADVEEPMVRFIEDATVPVCMVGLLYALPNTQLTRRLQAEGRLFRGFDVNGEEYADQCVAGLNFVTRRDRREILTDYIGVLERIYDPGAFFGRVRRLGRALRHQRRLPEAEVGVLEHALRSAVTLTLTELREGFGVFTLVATRHPRLLIPFLRTFLDCVLRNPSAIKAVLSSVALYLHVGPYSRHVVRELRAQVAAIDDGSWEQPEAVPASALVSLGSTKRGTA